MAGDVAIHWVGSCGVGSKWWMCKALSVTLQICGVRLGVVEQCGRCWVHLLLHSGSLGFWSAILRQ